MHIRLANGFVNIFSYPVAISYMLYITYKLGIPTQMIAGLWQKSMFISNRTTKISVTSETALAVCI